MRKAGWPNGLYERGGYFSWRNPQDGREYGLGRDRAEAIAQAVEANLYLLSLLDKPRLVDALSGGGERTVGTWFNKYELLLAKRKLADNTRRTLKSQMKRARALLGESTPIKRVTTLTIADVLESLVLADKARTAQAMRAMLKDAFNEALASGWIESNPVIVTRRVEVEVKRSRLTLETFRAIYGAVGKQWLRNAMDLALVTAQRREDVAGATFADCKPDGWYVRQGKTGKQLIIPLELRLEAIGKSVGDVVRQCRASGAVSRYLIHQTRAQGNSPVGTAIFIDRVSKAFAIARDSLAMDWGDREPPTFHEIRSLAERLYRAQGNVSTQELLGHSDAETTRLYNDARGAEWTRVKVGT